MKKLTALLLCLCLMALPARAEAPVWAADAYRELNKRMFFFNDTYSSAINRRRFVDLLVRTLDNTVPKAKLESFPRAQEDYFCDFAPTVAYQAAGYGFMEGAAGSDGLRYFNGEDPLTREQAAKLVCSLLDFISQKLGYSLEPSGSPVTYADEAAISAWALPYTRQIAAYGLMKGDQDGCFNPLEELDNPSAAVLVHRLLGLIDQAALGDQSQTVLQDTAGVSSFDYILDNGDGTVSGLASVSDGVVIQRFATDGSLVSSKALEQELPISGGFLDGGSHYYLAFGQSNMEENDGKETWRIVQYDKDWNRLAAASVSGGDSYTTIPFYYTDNTAMTLSEGGVLCLHTARQRYLTPDDGLRHQSNFTVTVDTSNMRVISASDKFPDNHVSHSFDQHARYDGQTLVTVDRGDAYPRGFVLQTDTLSADLLSFARRDGEIYQQTNSLGCGLEVSEDGYLFLGCSDPQGPESGQPWNVFLTYTSKEPKEPTILPWPEGSTDTSFTLIGGNYYNASWTEPDTGTTHWVTRSLEEDLFSTTFTWLSHSDTSISRAKLVKLDGNSFVAMWDNGADVHYQKLDGKGQPVGEEQVLPNAILPLADPVVIGGDICWFQRSPLPQYMGKILLYRVSLS